MEKSSKDIVRITEEEDATFDQLRSQHIQTYVNIHRERIEPYHKSDLNRLNAHCFYTRPILKEEIMKYFNRTKHKAPNSSKIYKKKYWKNAPRKPSPCF